MKRLFRVEPIDRRICATRNPKIDNMASAWSLLANGLSEEKSFIQVNREFIVSLGAHFRHQHVLFSRHARIDYFTGLEMCNYLSFLFDTPISLGISLRSRDCQQAFRGLAPHLRALGINLSDAKDLQEHLAEATAFVHLYPDGWQRILPMNPSDDPKRVVAFDLPIDHNLRNALVAYRQALLSTDPIGQILNYWRVLEATAKSPAKRTSLLRILPSSRLQPVMCTHLVGNDFREFNAISKYRRLANRHRKRLLRDHGSVESAMEFLYKRRRCPSAHADRDVLRPDATTQLRDLYSDALLLKLLGRLAIEKYYATIS